MHRNFNRILSLVLLICSFIVSTVSAQVGRSGIPSTQPLPTQAPVALKTTDTLSQQKKGGLTPRQLAINEYQVYKKTPTPDVFGSDLFNTPSLSFQPNLRIATPGNYVLGPDDQLDLTVSGYQETSLSLTVSPEGNVSIPQVGSIRISGLSIDDAISAIKSKMSQTAYPSLKNGTSRLTITLGKIKSIRITVIGAQKPGNFTLSSLTTVFNALYECGGPGDINTYRNIELIRNNKIYKRIDLYQFITKGDQDGNVLLKENDVINFPVYKKHVSISGQVKRPGNFELKDNETFSDLIAFAGGYTDAAFKASVKVRQITDTERRIKDILKAGMNTYIPSNGDSFQIDAVLDRVENAVSITGAVYRPGEFELIKGLTISALIKKAGGLTENAYTDRAILTRTNPENGTKEDITFNVKNVMNGGSEDITLFKRDLITLATTNQFISNYNVQILGEVRNPGTLPYSKGLSLKDVFFLANGFTDAASSFHVEVSRRLVSERSNKSADTIANVFDFTTTKDLAIENSKFLLQPFDVITVRRNPGYVEQQRVTISGEVNYPGSYTIESKKERVSDLLKRSGGLTSLAYVKGIFLTRNDPDNNDAQLRAIQNIQRSIRDSSNSVIEDVTRTNNRIAIDLQKILNEPGSIADYILENGDNVQVLKADPLVKISGEVLSSTKTSFIDGKSLQYYISQAGGTTDFARRRKIYVVYANGRTARTHNGIFGIFRSYPNVETGAEIIVPRKIQRKPFSVTESIGVTTAFLSFISLIIVTISTLKR